MTSEVESAIDEIRKAFAGHKVEVNEEAQGGAYVIVHGLSIGDQYTPSTSWVGFLIPYLYPRADVYPHFIDNEVSGRDGMTLNQVSGAFQVNQTWQGRSAIQVSRKSNAWDSTIDTAALKLAQVLDWVRSL
jgi:Prokaryotic E2 family E